MNSTSNKTIFHYGIPRETLTALGSMLVAAAVLEDQMHHVARSLCVKNPEKMQPKGIRQAIKESIVAHNGMPAWTTITEDGIGGWLDSALNVLDERHRFVHASTAFLVGNPVPIARHMKTGLKKPLTADSVNAVTKKIQSLIEAGMQIDYGLMVELRTGAYLDYYPQEDGECLAIVVRTDGRWPVRPTGEEIAAFWDANDDRIRSGTDYPRNSPRFLD
ncbi:hypothetical protein [Arthrobacter sp. HLT1-20]